MDGSSLNISSLKDKVAQKLKAQNDNNKGKSASKKQKSKNNNQAKEPNQKEQSNNKDKGSAKNDKRQPVKSEKSFGAKESSKEKAKSSSQNNSSRYEESEEEILRREALELGATEEDLKLLSGLSDKDYENKEDGEILEFNDVKGAKNVEKSDLEAFIKQIGLSGQSSVIADEDVEEEQEEEEEEEEEVDGENDSDEDDDDYEKEEVKPDIRTQDKASSIQSEEPAKEKKSESAKPEKKQEQKASNKEEMKKMTSVNTDSLLMPVRLDWYNFQDELPVPTGANDFKKTDIDALYEKAKNLTEQENAKYYEEFSKKSSQKKFFTDILTSGTLNDKISALTLMIQEAPLHNMKSLDTLLAFCSKKSRTAALQAINSLKDLIVGGLLPSTRKLKHFKNQPLNRNLSNQQLILFYFEDFLKAKVFSLLEILERLSHDTISHVKMSAVSCIFELLKSKPEQEQNLLTLGVNKLGDIDHKISAQTSFAILQLEQAHPAMKQIIVKAVIDFMNKNYDNYNTKYYSALALNQTILTRKEVELANILITSYFLLFRRILLDQEKYQKDAKVDEIGKVQGRKAASRKGFKRGKKGGKSVKPVEKTENEIKEEQNSKLFSAVLSGLNRAFPFADLPDELYVEHLDSLYKIAHSSNFSTSIQALSLIHHIVSAQKLDNTRFYKSLYESLLDERLANSSKQGLYLNLLYKALKEDKNLERVLAFIKRILQVCFTWLNIGAVSGMLYLLLQLEKYQPAIRALLKKDITSSKSNDDADSEEENKEATQSYDPAKRDPRYAHAENTSFWEIIQFLHHFHPSVRVYSEGFYKGAKVADPSFKGENGQEEVDDEDEEDQAAVLSKPDLGLYTLSHFLDKFVYKNPKQKVSSKGQSIMQPLGGAQTGSLLVRSSAGTLDGQKPQQQVPVNLKDWFNKRVDDISPDEKFFYEFFKNRKREPKNVQLDATEDVDSDLDEDEVWKALVTSRPDIDGEGDEFSDEDISFDEAEFSSAGEEDSEEDEAEAGVEGDADLEAAFEAQLDEVEGSDDNENEDSEDSGEEGEFTGFVDDEGEQNGGSESEEEEDAKEASELFKQDEEDEVSSDADVDVDVEEPETKKRSRDSQQDKQNKSKKARKQKMKDLPTFASAEDYAQYLGSDSE